MRIAIDAMGEIMLPLPSSRYRGRRPERDIDIVLVGTARGLVKSVPANVEIVEAPEVIENEDKPLMAIRRKRNSSMVVALGMVKRHCPAVVSAGNTGALMAGKKANCRPNSRRKNRHWLLCLQNRLGAPSPLTSATMDPKPIFQYALMGALYARTVFGLKPRVGLLNVGLSLRKAMSWQSDTAVGPIGAELYQQC